MNARKFIRGGSRHSLAIRQDGTVWAWGRNDFGQVGDGTTVDRHVPTLVAANLRPIDLAAGDDYSLVLADRPDGRIYTWGRCSRVGTPINFNATQLTPTPLAKIRHASSIDANVSRITALYKDVVYDWGGPPFLDPVFPANVSTGAPPFPKRVAGVDRAIAVVAGRIARYAVRDTAPWLLAWGQNNDGQLGNGTMQDSIAPVVVHITGKVIAVASNGFHVMALTSNGRVWTWGLNNVWQLGDENVDSRSIPARLPRLEGIKAIAAGGWHCLALDSERRVWSWGYNSHGQLGDGTFTMRWKPLRLNQPRNIVAIAAGGWHSLAVDSGGRVWSWGYNSYGQLGDGTTTDRPAPILAEIGEVGFPP